MMKHDSRSVDKHHMIDSRLKLVVEKIDDVQNILSDDCVRNILKSVETSPKSILQLCAESKISISTGYRIIQKLSSHGLVKRAYVINKAGKKTSLYKI